MPTAGKIFIHRETMAFEEIHEALEDYKESTVYEEDSFREELTVDISNLELGEDLSGVYSYDDVDHRYFRGAMKIIPYTVNAPFVFIEDEDAVFLVIIAKKSVANSVANKLSLILHGQIGAITEPVITPRAMEGFYKDSEGTKIFLFDDIMIPNMDKLTLYGGNVVQTNLFNEYINEGSPWYIVAKTKKTGYTVGLVRSGSVTVFSSVDRRQFLEYIKDEIIPLILRRRA